MIQEHHSIEEVGPGLPRYGILNSVWLRRLLLLLVAAGLALLLSRVDRATTFTLEQTRSVATLAAILLGLVAAWGLVQGIGAIARNRRQFAWRLSFGMVGWIGIAGSVMSIALLLLAKDSDPKSFPLAGAARAVELVIPLVVGIQTAFLFSPDDEPSIEVLAACPRPLSWILLERLLVLVAIQTILALAGMLISLTLSTERDLAVMLARWISPVWLFAGIAAYTTVRSRQPAFSVLVVGLVWFVCSFLGVVLLPGATTFWPLSLLQPFMWAFHAYLQPQYLSENDYWLNRVVVAALGIVLLMLTARQIRDVEKVFTGNRSKHSSRGG